MPSALAVSLARGVMICPLAISSALTPAAHCLRITCSVISLSSRVEHPQETERMIKDREKGIAGAEERLRQRREHSRRALAELKSQSQC